MAVTWRYDGPGWISRAFPVTLIVVIVMTSTRLNVPYPRLNVPYPDVPSERFTVPQGRRQYPLLQSGVVQYLHRLVVCLEEEVLPFIPAASEALLRSADVKKVQEYLPLIGQVVAKYKVRMDHRWPTRADKVRAGLAVDAPVLSFSACSCSVERCTQCGCLQGWQWVAKTGFCQWF